MILSVVAPASRGAKATTPGAVGANERLRAQPLAIIKEILAAFGEVADPWLLAAWFHFPNGWIVRRDATGTVAVAPRDALDRRDAVLAAAARRPSSYVA